MDEAFRKIAERGLISVETLTGLQKNLKLCKREGCHNRLFRRPITGLSSSTPEKCYAYNVYSYFRESFKKSNIKYINAGIGATTHSLALLG